MFVETIRRIEREVGKHFLAEVSISPEAQRWVSTIRQRWEVIPELSPGTSVPRHLGLIPDGDRRWARDNGLQSWEGHWAGLEVGKGLARACQKYGIEVLTAWGFSTENWKRNEEQVRFLLTILEAFLRSNIKELCEQGVRFRHLGRKDRLPEGLIRAIQEAEQTTRGNSKFRLNIAIDYGGRDEIGRAVQKIARSVEKSRLRPEDIDERVISCFLDTGGVTDKLDLIIRTSGEQRLSGFMPWQGAYAEFYFVPVHLPELTPEHFQEAIIDFSRRERRFGGDAKEKS